MKKLTLLLGATFIMGATAFAHDGHKEGCCKGKSGHCTGEKAAKEKGSNKKGEKTATINDASKAPVKEAKTTSAPKKS
ncbi:hypothetical protein [Taibaiella koreensis]|uniref:hypothetical protein n=1 Tax=Taibaiella koreensis TaxID=1268548 RepID=UPI000E59C301|nr:hypothetical protein [Taibaiella koreensis]